MSQFPSSGTPGIGANPLAVAYRSMTTLCTQEGDFRPNGRYIDGTNTRDPDNTPVTEGRAGLLMGVITATGLLAAAVLGVSQGSVASAGTSLTVTAAQAAEIVRRVGATGTLSVITPPAASGVVSKQTATYSAVNTTTGVITITALGVNEVQTFTPTTAATGGNFTITVTKPTGVQGTTGPLLYSSSIATIQTALDLASGVANGIVASGAGAPLSSPNTLTLTYSGTGYAGLPQSAARLDLNSVVGTTVITYTRTTAGVNGAIIAGALIGVGDGSEDPFTFLFGPTPIRFTDVVNASIATIEDPLVYIGQKPVKTSLLINYPTDSSLKAYVKAKLRLISPGMCFDDDM